MAEGKWITDLSADTPLASAARHVLTVRLRIVAHYLPLAMREPEKDPEHIHQLRVGTRRAGAAVDMFALCLPEKTYRLVRKHLRRIRRSAGAARDWDVSLTTVTEWAEHKTSRHRPAYYLLVGYGLDQRIAAQNQLLAIEPHSPFEFERLVAETVAAVHKPRYQPEMETLLGLARPWLGGRLRELKEAAAQDLANYDNLHQVRIQGKRLRYAMEVFADCFPPAFREEIYPDVEEMQEILGDANDSHVNSQRLEEIRNHLKAFRLDDWKRFKPGMDDLLRYHEKRLQEGRQRFLEWWSCWEDADMEQRLGALLQDSTGSVLDPAGQEPAGQGGDPDIGPAGSNGARALDGNMDAADPDGDGAPGAVGAASEPDTQGAADSA